MGLFDQLKDAIFHHAAAAPAPGPGGGPPATHASPGVANPAATNAGQAPAAAATAPASTSAGTSGNATTATARQPVDLNAVLRGLAARKGENLNWQSSIVDLMKLVDLDPSLENRRTLAHELGFHGDEQDTASMNLWLHRQVMQRLAASGGQVPAGLH